MRPSRVRRPAAALLLLCWLPTACRSYAAVPMNDLAVRTPVRVHLTDRGSVDLADALGPRASRLDGRVVSQTDSVLTLQVSAVTRLNGVEEGWKGETVRLPLAAIASVQRERVSTVRSGLLAGGVVAALLLAVAAFGGDEATVRRGPPSGPVGPQ